MVRLVHSHPRHPGSIGSMAGSSDIAQHLFCMLRSILLRMQKQHAASEIGLHSSLPLRASSRDFYNRGASLRKKGACLQPRRLRCIAAILISSYHSSAFPYRPSPLELQGVSRSRASSRLFFLVSLANIALNHHVLSPATNMSVTSVFKRPSPFLSDQVYGRFSSYARLISLSRTVHIKNTPLSLHTLLTRI